MESYVRPFLKWPGGKYRVLKYILPHFPGHKLLIEPFVGSGAVFLNTNFDKYILGDINPDLVGLYKSVQEFGPQFIKDAKKFFVPKNNKAEQYYKLRSKFNCSNDIYEKSLIFLYMNRHGYNGLCRYNKTYGHYNVPFGTYKSPYFPEHELNVFHEKSKRAKFYCCHYEKLFSKAKKNTLVYADPPYVPLSNSAYFTQYHKSGFALEEQERLAQLAEIFSKRDDVSIVLSNHSTVYTKKIYSSSKIYEFYAPRMISCKNRKKVKELVAVYLG